MGLYLGEIYRSPNIGVFLKANDKFVLIPKGLADSKTQKLSSNLDVAPCRVSVAGSRLLGPLISMNNNGMLVSRLVEDYEMREIIAQTGMSVARFDSKYTAVGNLVVANDKGAIVSPILDSAAVKQVKELMGTTDVETRAINEYVQVGSMVVPTNSGVAVYPTLSDSEMEQIGHVFGVEASPVSVNGGIPFVASGLVANSRNAVAGNLTTGPELVFLTKALKV